MLLKVCSKNDECSDSDTNKQDTCSPPSNLKVPKNQKAKERAVSPNVSSQLYQTPVSPIHHARPRSPNVGKETFLIVYSGSKLLFFRIR